MDVVVVESPAKAKTINKYLGSGYRVLASYGHVRDLPARDGSVVPERDFAMVWDVDPKARKRIEAIADALQKGSRLILATDPDREGEAISWHVKELLEERRALDDVEVQRVVFHEITKDAVLDAMAHPRSLNRELIEAYLARRALDYLVGFTLSPVLWRKLPGARSAGRVQSVALRLVCEREAEIEAFRPQEYWTLKADFATPRGEPFGARLTHLGGRKLERLDIADERAALEAKAAIESRQYRVGTVERKTVRRNPAPPFTTSTLQQEANRKLRFSATRTMQIAQRLYEGIDIGGETVGLITYMRTDSVTLSREAAEGCRRLITQDFGEAYLPPKPRVYRTRAKNAQEAHEAIRPTDLFRRPDDLAPYLEEQQLKLYRLIWTRTVACQMASAIFDQVGVDIVSEDREVKLRAHGSVMRFDGFLRLYQEGRDEKEEGEEREGRLPDISEREPARLKRVEAEQHFTQPPPRYTEASLVKKLEELGIGRPSTYAQILKVLQDRDYVRLEKRHFIPQDRGRIVTAFLTSFFRRYVEYGFTADLEEQLDDISGGRLDWKKVLRDFWQSFSKAVEETKALTFAEVLDALDRELGAHFFPTGPDGDEEAARRCPACGAGRLSLKLGRFGAFIGCSNYPECRYTRQLVVDGGEEAGESTADALASGPRILGRDPETGLEVSLRKGPYGVYVQLGETNESSRGKRSKPKRVSLPKKLAPDEIDLETALRLLSLPREVGRHPETGEPITAGLGRYGPYLKHAGTYTSLGPEDDVLTIGLNRAVTLLAEARSSTVRELGSHPEDGKPVTVRKGRYGPYVKHGSVNATLPKDMDMETIGLEEALALLEAKKAKGGKGTKGSPGRRTGGAKRAGTAPAS